MRTDSTTRTTLLTRVRDTQDSAAWVEFQERYRDMLLRFCRSRGLQFADAEDAVQIVFAKLAMGLRTFEYDPSKGRFRDYLFRCVKNAISDLKSRPSRDPAAVVRAAQLLESDAPSPNRVGRDYAIDGDAGPGGSAWEREWVHHHYRLAIRIVGAHCEPRSVEVFNRALAGRSAQEIALELNMSEEAVHKAKQRMKDRLKEQITLQVREEDGIVD